MDHEFEEALRTYAAQTPPADLEERIMRRASEFRRPYWPLAMAAGLLLGIVLWPVAEAPESPRPPVARKVDSVPAVVRAPMPAIAVRQVKRRPSQFPAPVPLTKEERALLDLFKHSPELAESLNTAVSPIKIAELQIEPISECN